MRPSPDWSAGCQQWAVGAGWGDSSLLGAGLWASSQVEAEVVVLLAAGRSRRLAAPAWGTSPSRLLEAAASPVPTAATTIHRERPFAGCVVRASFPAMLFGRWLMRFG